MQYTLFMVEYFSIHRNSPTYWAQEFLDITLDRFPELKIKYLREYTVDNWYVGLIIARPEDQEALEDLMQCTMIPLETGGKCKIEHAWAHFLTNNPRLVPNGHWYPGIEINE